MLIQSPERLDAALHGTLDLTDAVFVDLDLRAHSDWLHDSALNGAFFLGCLLHAEDAAHIVRHGGLVFPALPDLPYKAFRSALYTAEELLEGYEPGRYETFFAQSRDGAIYRHYKSERRTDIVGALAHRLHDHSIDVALADHLAQHDRLRRTVGIMGGHSMRRDDPRFATIAELGWKLQQSGHYVTTGGGAGRHGAGNLGAWMAERPHQALLDAVRTLAPAPTYKDIGWFDTALEVKARHSTGCESLGIPTWFYGHEPSDFFATAIAKYFANSVREDGIISLCQGGLVFAPARRARSGSVPGCLSEPLWLPRNHQSDGVSRPRLLDPPEAGLPLPQESRRVVPMTACSPWSTRSTSASPSSMPTRPSKPETPLPSRWAMAVPIHRGSARSRPLGRRVAPIRLSHLVASASLI